MHTISRHVLVQLPTVLGVDLSITNEVLLVWAAAALTFILLSLGCRRSGLVPKGAFRNVFEVLVEFIDAQVVRTSVGAGGQAWAPFLLTLFFFILVSNLIGTLPAPHHVRAATANINVTAALALVVFGTTVGISVRQHGFGGFLRKFVPGGVPGWLAPLVIPIEIVSWLARPLSLAIRLFANMVAGHSLILIFIGLASASVFYVKPLPLAGAVAMSCFELFVCFVQAFVFTLLSGIYIREALESDHAPEATG